MPAIDTSLYINRELSWLAFNARVLHEAFDPRNRLLERLKFLSIFSTNLDEFYMVRVAGLRRQIAAGVQHVPPDGMTPSQQLGAILERVADLVEQQRKCLYDVLLPELGEHGIKIVRIEELTPAEWLVVDQFFESQVFPVLTPLAVDPGHPFPYISNLSLSLAVQVFDPATSTTRFARVKVPKVLPRWIPFGRPNQFVPLELGYLMWLATMEILELRDPPFVPATPPELRDTSRSIFDAIRERDILLHHPFDSFPASVEHFMTSAAVDPNVLAIKMTLYRTSGDTAIVRALTEAAQRGKQVAVLIELQARFDEVNNITWARQLEGFGVHVAYGLPGLKTHTKTVLVVRREPDGIRRYSHIGSGNYNSKTAHVYTDLGLLTSSPSIGADLTDLFNALTGFSHQSDYRNLLVAPANMRKRFIEMVDREADNAMAGKPARIIAKMNALVDAEIIQHLYEASQAGVEIDLIVRGICCLRPGIAGISDHIRVISIVGRFLEHSRIFYFANAGLRSLIE